MNVTLGDMLRRDGEWQEYGGTRLRYCRDTREGSVTVHFGYGRTASGRVGNNIGYNAYAIQDAASPYVAAGTIAKTGEHYRIANVQETQTMAGREPVRAAELANIANIRTFPTREEKPVPKDLTLYPDQWHYTGYKWGMAIDLNICTGCSACIIACQAENNIAVVGKDQVARGRHMHWIRVDRYYRGNLDEPEMYNQPVPCMHCENAPVRSGLPGRGDGSQQRRPERDGLQPLRRHPLLFQQLSLQGAALQLLLVFGLEHRKPVRRAQSRRYGAQPRRDGKVLLLRPAHSGEQRSRRKKKSRRIRDGEILTACQQVCPTQAITFGDLNDPRQQGREAAAHPNAITVCWTT